MTNRFNIGDRVVRIATGDVHTIETVLYREDITISRPIMGDFTTGQYTGYVYRVDGLQFTLIEDALRPWTDDSPDPAFTEFMDTLTLEDTVDA